MKNERKYFGTDGIRGRANSFLTPELAMRVGMAGGILFRDGQHRRVIVGKDTRLSSYTIEYALAAGFSSAGMDVLLTGPIPTPAVAMLTPSMRCDVGVVISASHNPYADNGIKFFGADGFKLTDELELKIEDMIISNDFSKRLATSDRMGRIRRVNGAQDRYVEWAKRTLHGNVFLEGLRIVVDCSHGAGYEVAPKALWELGAEVVAIGIEPNGYNINDAVGSTHPEATSFLVKERRADLGIAIDGDADRVVLVDEKGNTIDGDQIMAVIAESWLHDGRLSKKGIVATVMSNLGLERYLTTLGLTLVRTAVGDRYVSEQMRAQGYNVGGEQSGHIILLDYATTGDGLVAALQFLAVMKRRGLRASEVCNRFKPVPQALRNFRFEGKNPLENGDVQEVIEVVNQKLNGVGRLVIRPSGTEPLIRVMVEADDADTIEQIMNTIGPVLIRSSHRN